MQQLTEQNQLEQRKILLEFASDTLETMRSLRQNQLQRVSIIFAVGALVLSTTSFTSDNLIRIGDSFAVRSTWLIIVPTVCSLAIALKVMFARVHYAPDTAAMIRTYADIQTATVADLILDEYRVALHDVRLRIEHEGTLLRWAIAFSALSLSIVVINQLLSA